jgi:hypothetical protein
MVLGLVLVLNCSISAFFCYFLHFEFNNKINKLNGNHIGSLVTFNSVRFACELLDSLAFFGPQALRAV